NDFSAVRVWAFGRAALTGANRWAYARATRACTGGTGSCGRNGAAPEPEPPSAERGRDHRHGPRAVPGVRDAAERGRRVRDVRHAAVREQRRGPRPAKCNPG